MCKDHYTLRREVVHQKTRSLLAAALEFCDYGRSCPASLLLSLLVLAASRVTSLFQACVGTARACCYETARKALCANLPDEFELARRLNVALAGVLPRALVRRRPWLAIDLHLCPYHGQPESDPEELVRDRSKSGTTHFHAYATLYVVRHGQRFTLALMWVKAHERLVNVVKQLLQRAGQLGIRPALVLVDKAFWNVETIRYLQAAGSPFLMPVVERGRKLDDPRGPTSTRQFFGWRTSGFSSYTLRSKGYGRTATVSIAVSRFSEASGRQRTLVYAYWGFTARSTAWIRETYRRRYSIESSYRQLNQSRMRTSSRSPLIRLMRIALSLILRNVWVWLHYEALSTPHRGGRKITLGRMHYQTFLACLITAIENLFGTVDAQLTQRQLPPTLRAITP